MAAALVGDLQVKLEGIGVGGGISADAGKLHPVELHARLCGQLQLSIFEPGRERVCHADVLKGPKAAFDHGARRNIKILHIGGFAVSDGDVVNGHLPVLAAPYPGAGVFVQCFVVIACPAAGGDKSVSYADRGGDGAAVRRPHDAAAVHGIGLDGVRTDPGIARPHAAEGGIVVHRMAPDLDLIVVAGGGKIYFPVPAGNIVQIAVAAQLGNGGVKGDRIGPGRVKVGKTVEFLPVQANAVALDEVQLPVFHGGRRRSTVAEVVRGVCIAVFGFPGLCVVKFNGFAKAAIRKSVVENQRLG